MNASVVPRARSVEAGKRLEYFTVLWNSLEALVAIASGVMAGSVALVGFGLDSLIEMSSGLAMIWRLHVDADEFHRARRERLALRIVGASFIALAAWVGCDAIATLRAAEAPEHSPAGIAIAAASLIVMPVLARAKRKVARQLDSAAMNADARQTDICMYLSAVLLIGLILNAALGWWWADPVAALIMVPIIWREGMEALRGKACSTCTTGACPT